MIPEFFKDKEIFITGGSGVVGSAYIEKILRSCNVSKIYILLRPKKSLTLEERLAKIKELMVFRQLKKQKPNELDTKLIAIPGDVVQPMMGITAEWAKVLENVSLVFHCAATVRFDEPIKQALKLNVGGALEALKFAETLKKLEVFMHVSTFYSNPYLEYVEPKVYDSPMNWKFCLDLVEKQDVSEDELEILTRKLIVGFPNTYTFTKNLAESLVNEYKDKLPICIYRPAAVIFALEEPEPGFTPTFQGFMGIYAISGAGLVKTLYQDIDNHLDITPQDICIKNMLYYTVKTSQIYKNSKPKQTLVFQTSNYGKFNMTLEEYNKVIEDFNLWGKCVFEKNLLIPGLKGTSCRFFYMFMVLVQQILPALFIDLILMLTGRKPAIMPIQRRVFNTLEVFQPFMFNNYVSSGITLYDEMIENLKGTEFSIEACNKCNDVDAVAGFIYRMMLSLREILFKEDPKTLPKARRILKLKVGLSNFVKWYILYQIITRVIEYVTYYFTLLSNEIK